MKEGVERANKLHWLEQCRHEAHDISKARREIGYLTASMRQGSDAANMSWAGICRCLSLSSLHLRGTAIGQKATPQFSNFWSHRPFEWTSVRLQYRERSVECLCLAKLVPDMPLLTMRVFGMAKGQANGLQLSLVGLREYSMSSQNSSTEAQIGPMIKTQPPRPPLLNFWSVNKLSRGADLLISTMLEKRRIGFNISWAWGLIGWTQWVSVHLQHMCKLSLISSRIWMRWLENPLLVWGSQIEFSPASCCYDHKGDQSFQQSSVLPRFLSQQMDVCRSAWQGKLECLHFQSSTSPSQTPSARTTRTRGCWNYTPSMAPN